MEQAEGGNPKGIRVHNNFKNTKVLAGADAGELHNAGKPVDLDLSLLQG